MTDKLNLEVISSLICVACRSKVMADNVGQVNNRGRGAPRRPRGQADRGRRGGRGQPRGQGHQQRGGHFPGHRQGHMEDNDVEDDVVEMVEPAAPPREFPRRRVHIGATALDRMLQLEPDELILQITNRVSTSLNNVTVNDNDNSGVLSAQQSSD